MKPVTFETLVADQKERIFYCLNLENDVLDFINEINNTKDDEIQKQDY
jgi:hypothetical protein